MRTHEYFTGLAEVYDANRPSYPLEAIDAALADLPATATIVDVGCGTGISTRLLKMRSGAVSKVIGIDPNADMLAAARSTSNSAGVGIDYRVGTGETTNLPAGLADCIVVAQAFHWLRVADALREFHRVLKPGGQLALLWNVRDESQDEFTRAYSDIARRSMNDARRQGFETHDLRSADPTIGGLFRDAVLRVFPNPHRLSREGLMGRARSASYFPRSDNPLRHLLEVEINELFTRHAVDGVVTLWHRTELTVAHRDP